MTALRLDPPSVTVRAAAKINLRLEVGPPDDAGYHRLATVYQAVTLYDDVTATPDTTWSVHVTSDDSIDLAGVPADEGNLAVRAGMMLAEHHDRDLASRLDIHKGIPVMGGLAGGSADAAAALVAVDRLYDLQTPDGDLLDLAARLGSDVPFALIGGTATGIGRGEIVTPVTDNGLWWWVVVGHEQGLSTPAVYRAFDERHPDPAAVPEPAIDVELLDVLELGHADALAEVLRNDLQAPALDLRPDLQTTLDQGREAGALAAMLSGSGPTVLLLCDDQPHAHDVHRAMVAAGHSLLTIATAPVAGAHLLPTAL